MAAQWSALRNNRGEWGVANNRHGPMGCHSGALEALRLRSTPLIQLAEMAAREPAMQSLEQRIRQLSEGHPS